MHPPAAPASITSASLSRFIPPMVYTGTEHWLQISLTNSVPFPFSPFLQSVSKIVPRIICVAPLLIAVCTSLRLWQEMLISSNSFLRRICSTSVRFCRIGMDRCILSQPIFLAMAILECRKQATFSYGRFPALSQPAVRIPRPSDLFPLKSMHGDADGPLFPSASENLPAPEHGW